jgi:hypothetical protein
MSVTFGLIVLGFVLGSVAASAILLVPVFFVGYFIGKHRAHRREAAI